MEDETPSGSARAAIRVLDILELFSQRQDGLTLSEVATALAVPISSLHALMRLLQARGYLDRRADGRRYQPGPRLVELGRRYADLAGTHAAARHLMRTVADRCGEAVHVAVLAGREIVYVDGIAARYPFGVVARIGMHLPAHAAAAGKALLATLPDDVLVARYADADWPRLTYRTPPSLDALQREIEEVRWTGYAHDVEGVDRGMQCVAVTVPPEPGMVSAAISVSVPTARLEDDGLQRILGVLREVVPPLVAPPARPDGRLIGWSLANTHHETYREMRRAATEAVAQRGGRILWTDAHDDPDKQGADVDRLLEQRPDALLIQPVNAVSADRLFTMAQQRGVLAVCFQRPARSRAFDFFVGGNTYHEGCMQVHGLARAIGGQGGVLVIEGDPYNDNARNIAQGNRATLARYPGITLLDSQPSGIWSRETARAITQEALATYGADRLNGIIAANDDMAVGVAEVLTARGLAGRIALVGGDGDAEVLDLIRSGSLAGTAFQDPALLAVTAVDHVLGVCEGSVTVDTMPRASIFHAPAGPTVAVLDVPYTWIDTTNLSLLEDYWSGRAVTVSSPASVYVQQGKNGKEVGQIVAAPLV